MKPRTKFYIVIVAMVALIGSVTWKALSSSTSRASWPYSAAHLALTRTDLSFYPTVGSESSIPISKTADLVNIDLRGQFTLRAEGPLTILIQQDSDGVPISVGYFTVTGEHPSYNLKNGITLRDQEFEQLKEYVDQGCDHLFVVL